MQKWEYKILRDVPHEMILNELGEDGWELVAAGGTQATGGVMLFLKRPKPSPKSSNSN